MIPVEWLSQDAVQAHIMTYTCYNLKHATCMPCSSNAGEWWIVLHGGGGVCAPEVVLAKDRFGAVEDPAAPGGSLGIISRPSDTDMLGETPHNEG